MLGMSEKERTNWLDLIFGRGQNKKSALYSTGFTVIQDAIKTCSMAITSIMNYGHNTSYKYLQIVIIYSSKLSLLKRLSTL